MTTEQVIDVIARYQHLLALEAARLVRSGFVEAWVNQLDEERWVVIHAYQDMHKHFAEGAADDLKDEDKTQPAQPSTVKGIR